MLMVPEYGINTVSGFYSGENMLKLFQVCIFTVSFHNIPSKNHKIRVYQFYFPGKPFNKTFTGSIFEMKVSYECNFQMFYL